MNYYILIPLAALFINLFLFAYISGTGWNNSASRLYKYFCIASIIWELLDIITWSGISDRLALYLIKFLAPFSFLVPIIFLYFIYKLIGKQNNYYLKLLSGTILAATILLIFTDLYITSEIIHTSWGIMPTPGPVYKPVIFINYVAPVFYSIILIIHTIVNTSDAMLKKKLVIVSFGMISMFVTAFGTSIVFPYIINLYAFPRLASFSTIFASISIFITLVQYKFLALSDSKISYELLNHVADGIVICDKNGSILDINRSALGILELKSLPAKSQKIWEFFPASYNFNTDCRDMEFALTLDGKEKYIMMSQSNISVSNYNIGKMILFKDITSWKKSEDALYESEMLYHTIIDSSPDAICMADRNGNLTFVSQNAVNIFGYFDIQEVIGTSIFSYIDKDGLQAAIENFKRTINQKSVIKNIYRMVKKDGTLFWGETNSITIFDSKGRIKGMISIIRDATDRIQNELIIKKSSAEKEVLLKELQHRVKNNLNVVYSLLDFEAGKLSNDNDREILINAQNRIHSMGIVYEQLYNSDDLDLIDLDVYIKKLTTALIDIYSVKNRNIQIISGLSSIKLDSKRAVTLGLIINELVMNSIKYAFPHNTSGIITINLSISDGWIILEVKDNGSGITDDLYENKGGTLGLKLINLLIQHISGYLTIESADGMKATIRFFL